MTTETLGERIRRHRQALGWTQFDLAAEVEVCRCTVSNWETDRKVPSLRDFFQLADVLDIPAPDLWEGTS
jgi:transcriptional regulator with XRE-family HTH domain